jgi:hypothetical protein
MTKLNRNKQQALRQIQEHINWVRRRHGVLFEQASTIDVYYHPHQTAAPYNYVTPRRGGLGSGTDVRVALDRLAGWIACRASKWSGLFPEGSIQLKNLGLRRERLSSVDQWPIPSCEQEAPATIRPCPPMRLLSVAVAGQTPAPWLRLGSKDGPDPRGSGVAGKRGARQRYVLSGVKTTIAGGGAITNPLLRRLSVDTFTSRRRGVASAAIRTSVQYAQARGCSLVFLIAVSDAAAHLCRRLGFVDLDRLVTYCRPEGAVPVEDYPAIEQEGETGHVVAQSVPSRR